MSRKGSREDARDQLYDYVAPQIGDLCVVLCPDNVPKSDRLYDRIMTGLLATVENHTIDDSAERAAFAVVIEETYAQHIEDEANGS